MAHASAQLIGGRSHQCDATATYTHAGARAYVLLDGIGSSDEVRDWTRTAARRLALAAAVRADAEVGLRAEHAVIAAERARLGWRASDEPSAVAVVAVAVPGELLQVAWCGDARAYVLGKEGDALRLTSDHNDRQRLLDMGQAPGPYARNVVWSYLGEHNNSRPEFGAILGPAAGRLLLASDGAYEPLEDSCMNLGDYLTGGARRAAQRLVEAAVERGPAKPDNATALVADFG
jgi:serine/threonine protein phosphatase PrpC